MKENYLSPTTHSLGHKLHESHQFKDINAVDDTGSMRFGFGVHNGISDTQRVLFQRNNDAANQSQRVSADQDAARHRLGEKIVNELQQPTMQVSTLSDPENQRPSTPPYESQPQELQKPSQPSTQVLTEGTQPDSPRTTTSAVIDDSHVDDDADGIDRREVSLTDDVNDERYVDYDKEMNVEGEIGEVEKEDVEEQGIGEGSEVMNMEVINSIVPADDTSKSIRISDSIILCVTEGASKENSPPIILHEGFMKERRMLDCQVNTQEGTELMDIDKEAVFDDELLENMNHCILDDEELTPEKSNTIVEMENLIVDGSNPAVGVETPVQESPLKNNTASEPKKTPSLTSSGKKTAVFERLSQSKNTNSRDHSASKIKAEKLAPIKIKEASPRPNRMSSIPQRSNSIKSPNLVKQVSSLAKRPPFVTPQPLKKMVPATPAKKEDARPAFSKLSDLKVKNDVQNSVPRGSNPLDSRRSSLHTASKSNDKTSRRPSVPKFFTSASKSPLPKAGEAKTGSSLSVRQSEAEQLLMLRKPPVPKFSLSVKRKSMQNGDSPKPNSARKPPVPKLSELIKKKQAFS